MDTMKQWLTIRLAYLSPLHLFSSEIYFDLVKMEI